MAIRRDRAAHPVKLRYVALLRAVNVGGRTVKMAELRQVFRSMGLRSVQTVIASGNVIFETDASDAAYLEDLIERELEHALGFEVATFVRSPLELTSIAEAEPFSDATDDEFAALYVAFLKNEVGSQEKEAVKSLSSETDRFSILGRELFWLALGGMSGSRVSGATLERVLGSPATVRNMNTVRRLVEKCAG